MTVSYKKLWKLLIDRDMKKKFVLAAAGISSGADVYRVIRAGAEATGSSSGITLAEDRAAMIDEMIGAARRAWDERAVAR